MDSLVANYASSDDEEDQQETDSFSSKHVSSSSSSAKVSSLFSALPQPKSLPLFSSIPRPKQPPQRIPISKTPIGNNFDGEGDKDLKKLAPSSNKSSSVFSSLPQPKFQTQQSASVEKQTKKVVQFKPPVPIQSNNFSDDDDDDDEDEEEKERNKRKQSEYLNQDSSVKSFLSSIPAPKSSTTLGVLGSGSGSGSGRRSIIETEAPAQSSSGFGANNEAGSHENMINYVNNDMGSGQNVVNYANYEPGVDQGVESYASYGVGSDQNYVTYANYQPGGDQVVQSGDASGYVNYGDCNGCADYNGYGDYGPYGAPVTVQETAGVGESGFRMTGKRGRKDVPTEIVEVQQDELIKNRPREDQLKLTGIAFGPSYQPVATKGKPTKLHKRKHQIGSLYFDMKQKEMELAERRARGFQTKAQTQGKYGW